MEQNRDLLALMLGREGYQVTCARDGDEAFACLETGLFDLALMDVMMPGRTGLSVCEEIKSKPDTRLLPVILITGVNDTESRADDFLIKPVRKEELLARVHSLVRLKQVTDDMEGAEAMFLSLALNIEAKDPYTAGHSERVSQHAEELGRAAGLPEDQCKMLRRAGIVHDIGKVAVPDSVLQKCGPLTPEERAIMEKHPVAGERICQPLKSLRAALPIIRHHHERLDGSGYPDHLAGDEISLPVRVLQTGDVYDALTTARPYRDPLSPQKAIELMRFEVAKGFWDRSLVDLFADLRLAAVLKSR
jgi:putative two-component system response regulator